MKMYETFGEKMAQQVLEQIPTPVMAVNKNFQIVFLNAQGRSLLGMDWSEIEGRYCYDVMNSQQLQHSRPLHAQGHSQW